MLCKLHSCNQINGIPCNLMLSCHVADCVPQTRYCAVTRLFQFAQYTACSPRIRSNKQRALGAIRKRHDTFAESPSRLGTGKALERLVPKPIGELRTFQQHIGSNSLRRGRGTRVHCNCNTSRPHLADPVPDQLAAKVSVTPHLQQHFDAKC